MPSYARPHTLDQALDLLAQGGHRILAGGTDLYPAAEAQLAGNIIDITALPGLDAITAEGGGFRIGACATWTTLADVPLPPAAYALQQAARQVGGRQIQNVGTIGGNLCNASPAADGVPPLLVMGAEVTLASAGGLRRVALNDFLIGPRQTARRADEVLIWVHIPESGLAGRSAFVKLGARAYLVISIAMVAARVVMADDKIASVAIAVGACSGAALRLDGIERGLIGASASDISDLVTSQRLAALAPIDDIRATAAYRLDAAAELICRAVAEAMQ